MMPQTLSKQDTYTNYFLKDFTNKTLTAFIRTKIEQDKFIKQIAPSNNLDWNKLIQTKLFNNPKI